MTDEELDHIFSELGERHRDAQHAQLSGNTGLYDGEVERWEGKLRAYIKELEAVKKAVVAAALASEYTPDLDGTGPAVLVDDVAWSVLLEAAELENQ